MKKVAEIMTRNVEVVSPQDNIRRAAKMMDELNVGAVPVCENNRLLGMITDRDITVRATAYGKVPDQTKVADAMSTRVQWCSEEDDVDEVHRKMSQAQVRRIPVLSRDQQLVGIVALGDLAESGEDRVDDTLRNISTPAQPDRSQTGPGGARM